MTLIKEATFNVFDLETTSLNPLEDRIIEMASVRARLAEGIQGAWSSLVNPEGRPIAAAASAQHHLVDEDVAGAPSLGEALPNLLGGDYDCVAAHNAAFDTGFVTFEKPVLCTYRLAMHLWPGLEKHSNQFLRYHFKLACPEIKGMAAHRAEADALVTAHLLLFELQEYLARAENPETASVEDLVAWVEGPMLLLTCNFGKHKDKPWSQVPKDYLQWMVGPKGMTDLSRDTLYTVNHYLQA